MRKPDCESVSMFCLETRLALLILTAAGNHLRDIILSQDKKFENGLIAEMQHYSSWLKLRVYRKGLREQEFKLSKGSAPFTVHPSITGTCHVRAQTRN